MLYSFTFDHIHQFTGLNYSKFWEDA